MILLIKTETMPCSIKSVVMVVASSEVQRFVLVATSLRMILSYSVLLLRAIYILFLGGHLISSFGPRYYMLLLAPTHITERS